MHRFCALYEMPEGRGCEKGGREGEGRWRGEHIVDFTLILFPRKSGEQLHHASITEDFSYSEYIVHTLSRMI